MTQISGHPHHHHYHHHHHHHQPRALVVQPTIYGTWSTGRYRQPDQRLGCIAKSDLLFSWLGVFGVILSVFGGVFVTVGIFSIVGPIALTIGLLMIAACIGINCYANYKSNKQNEANLSINPTPESYPEKQSLNLGQPSEPPSTPPYETDPVTKVPPPYYQGDFE